MLRALHRLRLGKAIGLALISAFHLPLYAATYDVFILAGQSNMDARAHRDHLPPALQRPQRDVIFYHDERWTELAPGSSARPPPPHGFGPELSFGRTLATLWPAHRRVALIKHAAGGTSLAVDWQPESGIQLQRLLSKITRARAALERDGHSVQLRAFVWMQGERDATTVDQAERYENNLRDFIRNVRFKLDSPDLPFVIGRIQAPAKPFRDVVRRAQENIAASTPHVVLVNTDDLKLLDVIHYDAAALVELGGRFATAVHDLLRNDQESASASLRPGRSESSAGEIQSAGDSRRR